MCINEVGKVTPARKGPLAFATKTIIYLVLENRLRHMLKSLFLFSIFLSAFLQAKNELSPCGGWSRLFERQIDGFLESCNKQTNKCLRKNLFNSTLGSSKTIYNIFDRINEKARIVQRKAHKHTRQSKVFNLFYRFIGRNMRMFPEITSDKRLKSATRVMRVCINYEVAII